MKGSILAALSLAVLACTAEPPPTDTKQDTKPPPDKPVDPVPKPVEPVDGFFMAEGAPQPRACKVASDCTNNTIPDLANPCCQNPISLESYSQAYWEWIGRWRDDNCAEVTCPPPPPPAQPPECSFKLDCVAGSCVDACP